MTLFIDPDCLACVTCYRLIATVGTGQCHLVDGGYGGVCCDECDPVARAVAALDAIDGEDPEIAHGEADGILLEFVPAEVRDALGRLHNRCGC